MNGDLISRSAMRAHMEDLPTWHDGNCLDREDVISSVENAPAVDAVEVVRCKDCRWYQIRKWDDEKPEYDCRKTKGLLDVKPDDFCSYGERRGDE